MFHLTVEAAVEILDLLGCEHDTVYRGQGGRGRKETTPRELENDNIVHDQDARKVRIEFHATPRTRPKAHFDVGRRVKGSLADMVLDRLGAPSPVTVRNLRAEIRHLRNR